MPWFIHSLRQMYDANCMAQISGSLYGYAVAEPYASNLIERIQAAWWVLTGRAHAIQWPKPGDLEDAIGAPLWDRSKTKPTVRQSP